MGERIQKGEVIGRLGTTRENGGWTPHLHFQIMSDLLDYTNFPGVGQASKIDIWSKICPDPNLILEIDRSLFPVSTPTKQQTLATRQKLFGGNLSLSYDQPLKIVRGWMQYLYDESGRQLLDGYNNVPHVGLCHPHVVDAVTQQMKLLNTNTRYLNDLPNQLAQRILSTLSASSTALGSPGANSKKANLLEVCFFVNSASEANELALRLARAYTGERDLIVLDHAYHGNTTTMIDISPYKHRAAGGQAPGDWVHCAPIADIYRGPYKNIETAGANTQLMLVVQCLGLTKYQIGFPETKVALFHN